LPDFTGKFTSWGNFNFNCNGKTAKQHLHVHGPWHGDESSTFKHHETAHLNSRPDRSVHEFFRCHDR